MYVACDLTLSLQEIGLCNSLSSLCFTGNTGITDIPTELWGLTLLQKLAFDSCSLAGYGSTAET